MSAQFRSEITLPSGVVVEATIDVPDEASYPDQLELGEVVQRAASMMAVAYTAAVAPVPF